MITQSHLPNKFARETLLKKESLFKLQALGVFEFLICFAAGLVSIVWFEIISIVYKEKITK